MGCGDGVGQRLLRGLPGGRLHTLWGFVLPAPFAVRQVCSGQPPVASSLLNVLANRMPLRQPARMLKAAC